VKDEFEVARLYTDGSFQRQLEAEFEGDYRMYVHFAPPFSIPVIDWLTERRDPETGRMRKWQIPARWFLPLLRVLAKGKVLRHTPLNLPGLSAHRRLEQKVRRDYEATLEHLLANLSPRNLDLAVEIASLPEHIRGFEQVREEHIAQTRAKQDELLAAFRLHSDAVRA
jgi:indolepyruvate ferredoxin oxidoreductase